MALNNVVNSDDNVKENEKKEYRFVNSLALACQVAENVTKHVQIVILADDDNNLRCLFDVVDPDKIPKFAE